MSWLTTTSWLAVNNNCQTLIVKSKGGRPKKINNREDHPIVANLYGPIAYKDMFLRVQIQNSTNYGCIDKELNSHYEHCIFQLRYEILQTLMLLQKCQQSVCFKLNFWNRHTMVYLSVNNKKGNLCWIITINKLIALLRYGCSESCGRTFLIS